MKRLWAALSLAALSTSAVAALPPYHDSVKMMQTVLSSEELGNLIHGEIKAIVAGDNLTFSVRTTHCAALVHLNAEAPPYPGPTSYFVAEISHIACEGIEH